MLNKFAYEAKQSGRTSKYKLWQDGFHPVILNTNNKVTERIDYIHFNPIASDFVKHERDYLNSSYLVCEEEENYSMLNVLF